MSLEYGSDVLLSASTDGLLGIWRDQSPTKLLRFPAYSIRQTLSPDPRGAPSGTRQPRETWFLSISIRVGEAPSIFAGDSEGDLGVGDRRGASTRVGLCSCCSRGAASPRPVEQVLCGKSS